MQKRLKIFSKIHTLLLVIIGINIGLFFYAPYLKAQVSCKYSINFREDSNAHSAAPNQTLNFTAIVALTQGDLNCSNKLTIDLRDQDGVPVTSNNQLVSLQNNNGTAKFSFVLTAAELSKGTISITATVYSIKTINSINSSNSYTRETASSPWTVNITGTSSGSSGATIYVSPSDGNLNAGADVGIDVSISSGLYSDIESKGFKSIYFKLTVSGKPGSFDTTLPLTNFSGEKKQNYRTLKVTEVNGFKNGSNNITAELWAAGSTTKLATASTNVNVQGLAGGGGTCNTNTDCPNKDSNENGYICNLKTHTCLEDAELPLGSTCNGSASQTQDDCVAGASCVNSVCVSDSGTGSGSGTGAGSTGSVGPSSQNTAINCIGTTPDPSRCLVNPLPTDTLLGTFLVIIKGFMGALGVWAVLFIIVGAFQMIMASGSEEMYTKAKKTITWSILGLVIALMSFSIVAIVQNILVTNTPDINKVSQQ